MQLNVYLGGCHPIVSPGFMVPALTWETWCKRHISNCHAVAIDAQILTVPLSCRTGKSSHGTRNDASVKLLPCANLTGLD